MIDPFLVTTENGGTRGVLVDSNPRDDSFQNDEGLSLCLFVGVLWLNCHYCMWVMVLISCIRICVMIRTTKLSK